MFKKIYLIFLIWFFSLFIPFPYLTFWGDDLTKSDFSLNPWIFSPWSTNLLWTGDMETTVTDILINVIDLLIVSFWVLALLIMTIWAWYMIIYHGQEEFLSKWKTIFTAWLISLIVALSAWLIMAMINYLVYN